MKSRKKHGEIRVITYYDEKYSDSTYLKTQSTHWGGEHQLSIEGVALDYFNNDRIVR